MTDIKYIPNTSQVGRIEYHPRFSTICSIGQAPFSGTLDIFFRPEAELLEFESFEAWLLDRALEYHTIESFTRLVYDELQPHLLNLIVTCHATTIKHADVTCTISYGGSQK